jgi:transposase
MSATHSTQFTTGAPRVLYLGFELGERSWTLGCTVGLGQSPRLRTVPARNTARLMLEIQKAKARFGLADDTPVVSCYEAGRDGFWLHRFLVQQGITNLVVDSASIEVNRRKRRAKSDGLDAAKLVGMLVRWHNGERTVWRVVNVPTVEDEDRRQLRRELIALKGERTEHSNRIKGLLASLGMTIVVDAQLPQKLERLQQWDGTAVPAGYKERILREYERWKLVEAKIKALETSQRCAVRNEADPHTDKVRTLLKLRGIGLTGSWVLVQEIFGWRQIKNRRQLAALVGLTPTPYSSGDSEREQGISKAGNDRVRWLMVELAWCWLEYQPQSLLSRWYQHRFGAGNGRARKVGIVALARKLLIALWKYLDRGEVPEGAVVVHWRQKVNGGGGRRTRVAS